jgi:LysR family glycine cleavage system transcriptional activator
MLQAAAAGQGIAIASLALAGDDLAAGRLIRPLPHEMPVGRGYWLVRPTHGPESPRASLFRAWLYDEAERFVATMASAAPS